MGRWTRRLRRCAARFSPVLGSRGGGGPVRPVPGRTGPSSCIGGDVASGDRSSRGSVQQFGQQSSQYSGRWRRSGPNPCGVAAGRGDRSWRARLRRRQRQSRAAGGGAPGPVTGAFDPGGVDACRGFAGASGRGVGSSRGQSASGAGAGNLGASPRAPACAVGAAARRSVVTFAFKFLTPGPSGRCVPEPIACIAASAAAVLPESFR